MKDLRLESSFPSAQPSHPSAVSLTRCKWLHVVGILSVRFPVEIFKESYLKSKEYVLINEDIPAPHFLILFAFSWLPISRVTP